MMAAALIGDVYNACYETITTVASGKSVKISQKLGNDISFPVLSGFQKKITRA